MQFVESGCMMGFFLLAVEERD